MPIEVKDGQKQTKFTWLNLTWRQQKHIANGCGGKGGWVKPPNFMFVADCNHHDFGYWRGGDEAERKRCDKKFLIAMQEDVRRHMLWGRHWLGYSIARAYYLAVRYCGRPFFHYTTRPRGWENLEAW